MITITGQLFSKSNSRQIVMNKRTGKPMVIKNAKAIKCKKDFTLQLKALWDRPPIPEPVHLVAEIYYPSRRPDLDESLFMDCLQDAGVVENDRHIWEKHIKKFIDKENPRVEFNIFQMEQS